METINLKINGREYDIPKNVTAAETEYVPLPVEEHGRHGHLGALIQRATQDFKAPEPDMEDILEKHYTRIAETELQIISLVESKHPYEIEEVMSNIHSITFEAIPLEEQLPKELPETERIRILNDFYNMKYEALKSLMAEL